MCREKILETSSAKKVSPSSVSSPHSCPLLITNFFILYFDRKPRVPGQDTGNSSNNSPEDSEALLQWREAVKSSISASQVAVCISQLDRSIAWEKSPMKVVSVCVLVVVVFGDLCESGREEVGLCW